MAEPMQALAKQFGVSDVATASPSSHLCRTVLSAPTNGRPSGVAPSLLQIC